MRTKRVISVLLSLGLLSFPLLARADEPQVSDKTLLITELQATGKDTLGKSAASLEFIELYNSAAAAIDLTTIKLQYASAAGTTWSNIIPTPAFAGWLAPDDHLLLAVANYLPDTDYVIGSGLSGIAGHVRVVRFDPNDNTKPVNVLDTLGWGTTSVHPEVAPAPSVVFGHSLKRLVDGEGNYVDTDNNYNDFVDSDEPMPEHKMIDFTPPEDPIDPDLSDDSDDSSDLGTGTGSVDDDIGGDVEIPPAEEEQTPVVLLPLQLTELLPNPASPQTDSEDEFVEIYNPNSVSIDLKGWRLETGSKFSYRVYLDGRSIAPFSYLTIYSIDSNLTLSNSEGAARLLDKDGMVVASALNYENAPAGQAWLLVGDVWQWTTTPTAGLPNLLTAPVAESPVAKAVKTAKTSTAKPKTTTAKKAAAATTKKTASKTSATAQGRSLFTDPASDGQILPVNPSILAVVAAAAVGYSLYEYRYDLRNAKQKLRRHREVRRATRAKA